MTYSLLLRSRGSFLKETRLFAVFRPLSAALIISYPLTFFEGFASKF
jgi:hypothetical protein